MNTLERIIESREAVILNQKWLAHLILRLQIVEENNLKYNTAGTDGKHLFYNKKFVDSLSNEELDFLVAHESIHIGLLHCSNRFKNLIQDDDDVELLDMAKDYVVNDILILANFKMPKKGVHNIKYRGQSVEEVFEILKKTNKKYINCLKDHCLVLSDDDSPKLDSELAQAWSDALRQAAEQGSLPGDYLEKLLGELKPKIDWKQLLEEYLISMLNSGEDSSWKRLSRRGIAQGINLPTKKQDLLKTVIFMSDTSRSMSNEDINTSVAATFNALENFNYRECLFIDVDTKIQRVIKIESALDLPKDCKGRGGTEFSEVFKKLEDYYPDIVIFFSDLEVNLPKKTPSYPVIWITKTNNIADFGKTIRIN